MKHSIFQGNELIVGKVAEVLGYRQLNNKNHMWFTKDIYTQSFFYLTKRFGNCSIYDEYKDGGVWNFKVKNYIIQVYLNSSWVSFSIFGDVDFRMLISPYRTKINREFLRKKDKIIKLYKEDGTHWDVNERSIIEKLYSKFIDTNSINESKITQEEWDDKYAINWFKFLETYNSDILGVDYEEYENKYGSIYQNSYTRHALRTFEQFLKNMLTPIWIRDVPYNIKGCISDNDAYLHDKYTNNIEIEFINDETRSIKSPKKPSKVEIRR